MAPNMAKHHPALHHIARSGLIWRVPMRCYGASSGAVRACMDSALSLGEATRNAERFVCPKGVVGNLCAYSPRAVGNAGDHLGQCGRLSMVSEPDQYFLGYREAEQDRLQRQALGRCAVRHRPGLRRQPSREQRLHRAHLTMSTSQRQPPLRHDHGDPTARQICGGLRGCTHRAFRSCGIRSGGV